MGQLVAVTEKPSSTPGVVRFEINRTLSGQGHERFRSILDAHGNSPSDELARQLFGTGQVAGVHVYANIITVDLEKGYDSAGLSDLVRDLYMYWKPGVQPPSLEELQAPEPAAGAAPSGDSGGGGGGGDDALNAVSQLVPMHLLVRGKAAREKWNAKQA